MIEEYVCVFTFVFVRLFFGEPCYILSESVKPVFSRCLIARFVRGCNYLWFLFIFAAEKNASQYKQDFEAS